MTLSDSEPEPDLAVVRADDETAAARHPRTALLVIEIADSSARHDLVVKSQVYARAGIPEYWLVLFKQRVAEVLRDPDPATRSYRNRVTVSGSAAVTPTAFAGPAIPLLTLFD